MQSILSVKSLKLKVQSIKCKVESSKSARYFILLTFHFLLYAGTAQAQLATLDSKKILATMPVFSKVDTLLQEESMKYATDYKQKLEVAQSLTRKADSFARLPESPKTFGKSAAIEAAQKAQQDFTDYEKKVNQKLAEYKALILNPYYDKVNAAIKAVATRLKLSQVMDIQANSFAYIDPAKDITEEVIKQLKTK